MPSFLQLPHEIRALIYQELLKNVCVTAEPLTCVQTEGTSQADSLQPVQNTRLVPYFRKGSDTADEWLKALFSKRVASTDKAFAEAMFRVAYFHAATSRRVENLAENSLLRSVSANNNPLLEMCSLHCGSADFRHQGVAIVLSRFLHPTFPALQEVRLSTGVTAHWFRDDKVVFRPLAASNHGKGRERELVYQSRDLGYTLFRIVCARSPLFSRLCNKPDLRVVLEFNLYKSNCTLGDGRLPRISSDRSWYRDELFEASFNTKDWTLQISSPRRPDQMYTVRKSDLSRHVCAI